MPIEIKPNKPPDFSEYPYDYSEHCVIEERGDQKEGYDDIHGMAPEIIGTISRRREQSMRRNSHHSNGTH